jgi:hypothetical protein
MADVPRSALTAETPGRECLNAEIPIVLASFKNKNWAVLPRGLADRLRVHCGIERTYDLPLAPDVREGLPLEAKKLLKTVFEGASNTDQA